ncbi:MAG TPA: apolipoprotein N-acyltransferase, partial [Xanthobacteraceae bacterium]
MTDSAQPHGLGSRMPPAPSGTAALRAQTQERTKSPVSYLQRIAYAVVLAHGWRRAAIAFAAGLASALAMAPFHAWPLLFLTFPVLVWLIDGAAGARFGRIAGAAAAGWWFGFGYFLAGLYWVGIAFLVDAGRFGWLMPLAVLGLPAGLALLTALGTALAGALWTRGPLRILALALALTIAEWLRGHVLTGFPWNAFGYALTAPLPLAQAAALVGIWGLTFIAVLVFASPAVLADDANETGRRWLLPIVALALIVGLATYGSVRLATSPTHYAAGVNIRLMQPNLPQDTKFNYRAKAQVMALYGELSERSAGGERRGLQGVTHLIWPESAFPFLLTREPDALAQIAELLPPGTVLITGAARAAESLPNGRLKSAYNSIYVIDHDGSILSVYDKLHLVPFGEYLPFQVLLESFGLLQLTKVPGGFTAGDRRRLLPVPRAGAALPLICYEIIFPGEVAVAGAEPAWMLNLTNDG